MQVWDPTAGSVLQLTTGGGDLPITATLPFFSAHEVDLSFELNFLSGDTALEFLLWNYPDDDGDSARVEVTDVVSGSTRTLAQLDSRIATRNYTAEFGSTGWLPYSVRLPASSGPRALTFSATAFFDDVDASHLRVKGVRVCVASLTPTPTASPAGTLSGTGTGSSSRTGSVTPSQTPSQTETPTASRTGTGTPSQTPSGTGTPSASRTGSESPSQTPSQTGTASGSRSGTLSPSNTPSWSGTASSSSSGAATASQSASRSQTASHSGVTRSSTSSAAGTPTASQTRSAAFAAAAVAGECVAVTTASQTVSSLAQAFGFVFSDTSLAAVVSSDPRRCGRH